MVATLKPNCMNYSFIIVHFNDVKFLHTSPADFLTIWVMKLNQFQKWQDIVKDIGKSWDMNKFAKSPGVL